MNNISTKIMLLRKQNGMSQADLAKKLNVSNKLISKWETGGSLPSTEYLPKLCRVFNIKINDLMGEEDFPEIKSKYTAGKLSIITIVCIAFFCLFIAFCHLTLAPAILKRPFISDIDNHLDETLNGNHYYLTTTVEIDDVPTVIEEYGYVKNGTVEYIEYIDDELQVIIKDGIKYSTETNKREVFDNVQIKNLWGLYELTSKDDEDLDFFSDDSFIDYIYKQFNGYYFEVNKGVVNRFIDKELESGVRVTSKIKGDVDFAKGKLKSMTMSFEAKSGNVPIDVKITQKFNLTKAKQLIEFPDDINSKLWANIELKNLDNYIDNENVTLLNLELPNIYKSNNNIVSYDKNNIYLYNQNLELLKIISIPSEVRMADNMNNSSFYFNFINKFVLIKGSKYSSVWDLYLLNIETQNWTSKTNISEVLYISSGLDLYYKYRKQIIRYNLEDGTTTTLEGNYFVADVDGEIYTCDDEPLNDIENGIYKYKNGETKWVSDVVITGDNYVYNNLIFTTLSYTNGQENNYFIYNKNFEEIGTLPFNPSNIVSNQESIIVVGYSYYCNLYNYDNLFLPPIRFNVESVIAFEDYYIMKKFGENKLYKVNKSFINELGNW